MHQLNYCSQQFRDVGTVIIPILQIRGLRQVKVLVQCLVQPGRDRVGFEPGKLTSDSLLFISRLCCLFEGRRGSME